MHIENADAKPPHLGFWCVGLAFGVMLWFLKLFACGYDGEAPQEHLYLGLLAYSEGMRPLLASPLFQCSFSLPGLGPFGGPCVKTSA